MIGMGKLLSRRGMVKMPNQMSDSRRKPVIGTSTPYPPSPDHTAMMGRGMIKMPQPMSDDD